MRAEFANNNTGQAIRSICPMIVVKATILLWGAWYGFKRSLYGWIYLRLSSGGLEIQQEVTIVKKMLFTESWKWTIPIGLM